MMVIMQYIFEPSELVSSLFIWRLSKKELRKSEISHSKSFFEPYSYAFATLLPYSCTSPLAAFRVFINKEVTVIGPTPPGTGVI